MNAMLVTNHKGGVGKTFVSIHLAMILSENGNRVLLVDCDGQYDAFKFFARHKTPDDEIHGMEVSQTLWLCANKECERLRRKGFEEENYDYVVLDGDASMTKTIKKILENDIRLVVVPANDQANAIENLEDLFDAVQRLNALHYPVDTEHMPTDLVRQRQAARSVASQLLIVPLGMNTQDEQKLDTLLRKFRIKSKVKTHKNMPFMKDETKHSLTAGVPIWEVDSLSKSKRAAIRTYFLDLAEQTRKFFD